jgi:hypothetical protein
MLTRAYTTHWYIVEELKAESNTGSEIFTRYNMKVLSSVAFIAAGLQVASAHCKNAKPDPLQNYTPPNTPSVDIWTTLIANGQSSTASVRAPPNNTPSKPSPLPLWFVVPTTAVFPRPCQSRLAQALDSSSTTTSTTPVPQQYIWARFQGARPRRLGTVAGRTGSR